MDKDHQNCCSVVALVDNYCAQLWVVCMHIRAISVDCSCQFWCSFSVILLPCLLLFLMACFCINRALHDTNGACDGDSLLQMRH